MKGNFGLLALGIGGFVVGLVGIGYAIGARKRLNDICDKIDTTIDEVSWNLDVKVEDAIVMDAVDKAVDLRVGREVNYAVKDVSDEIRSEVRTAVKTVYPDIRKACTEKITDEMSKINVKELSDSIREDASKKVAEKFDGQLDDILDKFNNDLHNVSKIYASIADKMSGGNNNKEMKISLI